MSRQFMFKCPVCGENHVAHADYDRQDYECRNTSERRTPKKFFHMVPDDQLSRNGYNYNHKSTLINEIRPVTITNVAPTHNTRGQRMTGERKGVNY